MVGVMFKYEPHKPIFGDRICILLNNTLQRNSRRINPVNRVNSQLIHFWAVIRKPRKRGLACLSNSLSGK